VTVAYGKYHRNHFFELLDKISLITSWKYCWFKLAISKLRKSLSDSWIMKNTIEITVLKLFDILSMNICLKMVDLNLPYQIKKKHLLASIHWTLPKNVNVLGLSILEWREHFLFLYVKHISGSISIFSNRLAVTVVLWKML